MRDDRLEIKGSLSIDTAGTIAGTAWVFDVPDRVGDIITKGALNLPGRIPMLYVHDPKTIVGVWDSIVETDKGIEARGELFDNSAPRALEMKSLIKVGVIGSLSMGFRINKASTRPGGGRTISDLTLQEISICRTGVHPGAKITTKSTSPALLLADVFSRAAQALKAA